jgi:hypothetical protein
VGLWVLESKGERTSCFHAIDYRPMTPEVNNDVTTRFSRWANDWAFGRKGGRLPVDGRLRAILNLRSRA